MGIVISSQQRAESDHSNKVAAMPSAQEVPTKEGELLKYKNYFMGWGKRYFRLDRMYLHYFETKYTHAPLATITRIEISQVKLSTAYPDRENVFEIVQKNGTIWYCQAKSPEEMVSWMQALSPVPLVLDPEKYPMTNHPPQEQVEPNAPPTLPHQHPYPAATAPSPYQQLIEDAHQTAFANQTPHDHCHHHSPPPPYSPGENR